MRKKPIVNKKRPVNLDLGSLKFPPMAIASVLHRISGIALFILLPIILFILGRSLQSEEIFAQTKTMLTNPCYKLVLWAFSASLIYHVLAGIRHLLMDMGFGEHLNAGRRSAILVIVLAVILTIFLGIWIW
jgi:succinate dehydrogenase / fumarate reductase cytochrome b subunit